MHRRPDHVDAGDHQRVDVVVVRIAERRRKHHRAGGPGLVMVVHDLRVPLAIHDPAHVRGLRQRVHVRVAVVVVPGVMVVEHRRPAAAAVVLHVVIGLEVMTVRVGVRGQDDDVVQDAPRLLVVARDELIDRLHELLRAEHLARVQSAVDPDDRLPFTGELARLLFGQPFGERQAAGDLLVAIQAARSWLAT